jgi:hypothetical protein
VDARSVKRRRPHEAGLIFRPFAQAPLRIGPAADLSFNQIGQRRDIRLHAPLHMSATLWIKGLPNPFQFHCNLFILFELRIGKFTGKMQAEIPRSGGGLR